VGRQLALPPEAGRRAEASRNHTRVASCWCAFGLTEHANKYARACPAARKQRVGTLPRAVDQPQGAASATSHSALDPLTTASDCSCWPKINRGELNLTIVLITHEMDVVRRVCDRVCRCGCRGDCRAGRGDRRCFCTPQHPTTRRFVMEDEQIDEAYKRDELTPHVEGAHTASDASPANATTPVARPVSARKPVLDFSILAAYRPHQGHALTASDPGP